MLLLDNVSHELTTIELLVVLLYGGFILFLIVFGTDLLSRFIKADKRMRTDIAYKVFFIIAVAMIGYGIYTIPATFNYFFKDGFITENYTEDYFHWINALQFMLILMMIVPIGYVCLDILVKKTKLVAIGVGFIGFLGIVYLFVIMILMMNNPEKYETIPVQSLIYVLFIVFGIIDFLGIAYTLIVKLAPQKEVRNKVLLGILGIVIAGIGGYFEVNKRGPNNWAYVYGVGIELIGFIVMRYFFLSIPSYDEFAWKSGIIEMHVIIAETGISLYYHSFANLKTSDLKGDIRVTATIPEDEARPNTDLVAGGLVGIKGMLAEISGDKGKLENIEIGEKSLVFKQGKTVLCLLLADENLGVYHSMLDELVVKIEDSHPDLDNFNGDTRKIHIGPIVEEVFDLNEEGLKIKLGKKKNKK